MATLTENAAESEWLGDDLCDAAEALIGGIAHLRAFIKVENYLHTATAYGQMAADGLLNKVCSFFGASMGEQIGISADRGGGGFVVSLTRAVTGDTDSFGKHFAAQIVAREKLREAQKSVSCG